MSKCIIFLQVLSYLAIIKHHTDKIYFVGKNHLLYPFDRKYPYLFVSTSTRMLSYFIAQWSACTQAMTPSHNCSAGPGGAWLDVVAGPGGAWLDVVAGPGGARLDVVAEDVIQSEYSTHLLEPILVLPLTKT